MRPVIAVLWAIGALAPAAASAGQAAPATQAHGGPPPIFVPDHQNPPAPEPVPPPPPERARPRAPLASYILPQDYPPGAVLARTQGMVAYGLRIDPQGRVTACRIVASSGSAALDEATCRILRSRARYMPARDAQGNPVPDRDQGEFTWTLPPR